MRISRIGFGILFALLTVAISSPSAQADDSVIPSDVVRWFETMGPRTIAINSDVENGNLSFHSGSTLGDIVAIYQIDDQFLNSQNPSAMLLSAPRSWSAPVMADGIVVGTLTAERSSNGFGWFAGDDWWNGNMMATMPTDGRYVNDGRNGAFILVDTSVWQATNAAIQKSPHEFTGSDIFQTNTATLRDAIKQQRTEDALATKQAGEPVSGGGVVYLPDYVAMHGQSTPGYGWSTTVIIIIGVATLCLVIGMGMLIRYRKISIASSTVSTST